MDFEATALRVSEVWQSSDYGAAYTRYARPPSVESAVQDFALWVMGASAIFEQAKEWPAWNDACLAVVGPRENLPDHIRVEAALRVGDIVDMFDAHRRDRLGKRT